MIEPVSVYQLTPEQLENYQYGMDLGEPIRIEYPASLAGMNECTIVKPSLKQMIGQGQIPLRAPKNSLGEEISKPFAVPVRKVRDRT